MSDHIVPEPTVVFSPHIINLFWSHVNKTAGCWIWTGEISYRGYGRFRPGSSKTKTQRWLAHRFAWFVTFGTIPDGLQVCHDCPDGDNKACVRPDHLFLGTQTDNIQDALRKGQMLVGVRWNECHPPESICRGEGQAGAKLTNEQVFDIRARYVKGVTGFMKLAKEFHVSKATIMRIVLRRIWTHI